MKKTILVLLAAVCGATTASAQDVIVKTDDAKIESKVVEISPDAVRYKRFSNPDGPTYVLPTAQILYIRYANGEVEHFNKPAAVVTSQTGPVSGTAGEHHKPPQLVTSQTGPVSAGASEEPAPSKPATVYTSQTGPVQYVVRTYSVGDLYDFNGVKGIVCAVSDDRQHGLVISLDEIYLHWSEFSKPNLRLTGVNDGQDGAVNMEKMAEYIAANNLSWDDFPAFKWCREQGEGWYLPSINELLEIGYNYNGGSRTVVNRNDRNKFNDALKNNGGKRMDRLVNYFTSTEVDEKSAYTSHMDLNPPYVVELAKNTKFLVRAVHKF